MVLSQIGSAPTPTIRVLESMTTILVEACSVIRAEVIAAFGDPSKYVRAGATLPPLWEEEKIRRVRS